jgi:hypothetical protein
VEEYSVKMAVENIANAWNKITQSIMKGVWKKLLP